MEILNRRMVHFIKQYLGEEFGERILKWYKRVSEPMLVYYKRKIRDCKYTGPVTINKPEKERYKTGCQGAKTPFFRLTQLL